MFTLSQRHGRNSGLRLWRVACPAGNIVGYAEDLGDALRALLLDGETAARIETPSACVVVALLDLEPVSTENPEKAPAPAPAAPDRIGR